MVVNGPKSRIFYSGDTDIENGGMFYRLDTFEQGYVSAVRVTPCTDAGQLPDNAFWVECLTVNIPVLAVFAFEGRGETVEARRAHRALHNMAGHEKVECALACIGYDSPDMLADWDKRTVAERRHIVVLAGVSYGHFDQESSEVVSLGKPAEAREKINVDKVLRADASLRNYARGKL